MLQKWNKLFSNEYSNLEWKCIRITYALLFFSLTVGELFKYNSIPYPVGVLRLVNASILTTPAGKAAIGMAVVILLGFYVFEKGMLVCTLLLFITGVFVYSLGESNGVMGRNGILSLVFFAQFIAYALNRFGINQNLNKNRVQFSVQIIAAVYVLAGISKIATAGIYWFIDSPNIALQVLKSFDYQYATNGSLQAHGQGVAMAQWIIAHPLTTRLLLAGSLLLEVFSFVVLFNKSWTFVFGIFLFSMHSGMNIVMDIFFPSICLPMVVFYLNPLYLLVRLMLYLKARIIKQHTPGVAT